jgi:hypothetical protein
VCCAHSAARTIHTYVAPLRYAGVGRVHSFVRRRAHGRRIRSRDCRTVRSVVVEVKYRLSRLSLVGHCSLLLGSVGSANVRRFNESSVVSL